MEANARADREAKLRLAADERSDARRIAIHAGGAVVTIVAVIVVAIATAVVLAEISNSEAWNAECGTLSHSQLRNFHLAAIAGALVAAWVPALVGAQIRRLRMCAWPWFAVAVLATVYFGWGALRAQPTDWCFTF